VPPAPPERVPPARIVVRYDDEKRAFRPGFMHEVLRRREVIELNTRLIAVDPKPQHSLQRAEKLAKMGAWTEALEDIERALSLSPDDEIAIERREEILLKLGRPIEGLKASD
jgi:tetratricopeptide (TPR) repeat protein